MNGGEIDRLPVNQLTQRYRLARSAVYTRMDALGIKTEKIGNKAYVNAEQIQLMDDLHRFIQTGGNTAEFVAMRGIGQNGQQLDKSSGLSTVQPDMRSLIASVVSEVMTRLQPSDPEPHPLEYFEFLEKAVRNGWEFSTSELAYLLQVSPSEIQRYGDRFQDAGFVFTKVGFRGRGESAWQVSKRR